jgi:hypothetical protein
MSYDNLSSVSQNVLKFYQQSNNPGTAKVKIVKNERDPPLFTSKLLIKFQNILRNTTQLIIRHRVKILFSVISRGGSLRKRQGCQQPRFRRCFSDFQTLNPTSDIINVYSDVFKIQIFFVSGTVIRHPWR